ncbi:NUDIX hydrolase [Phytoactinopolyspora halotolerans]|uniref:CoA pyrophosphatase n=1 Tax=Phytoactinopolyspora halotolerans TaxID=1981512 RepID=A0A6L9S3P4_9ACTN|nr:CoA pyrophosphatase [Phytoactinopolyspora halotolerans]NED99211.1 CoA pyrophosphatase [Phytoactinopolyspora halotolerans]
MTIPAWLKPIVQVAEDKTEWPPTLAPPEDGSARASAVLMLFGETDGVPDVLLTERSWGLSSHAGQVAFPGGTIDPDDDGPIGAALREGVEETGLDPSGVQILNTLPTLWISVTNYAVTPVLAWWKQPSPVRAVDPGEVASVHRVPLDDLLDPANRMQVRHPSGSVGPAFRVGDLLVWGFTAGVLSRLFEVAEMERPWDRTRVTSLPQDAFRSPRRA